MAKKEKKVETTEEVVKEMTSSREDKEIKLSQISLDTKQYRHRDPNDSSMSDDSIKALLDEIVQAGGLRDRLEVAEVDNDSYVLISGHRRLAALRLGIKERLTGFHADMPVKVTIITPGKDAESFKKDLWVSSFASNSNRPDMTEVHKLAIIKDGMARGVKRSRVRIGLAMSETQFDRFERIVAAPWLHGMVVTDCIGTTHAATLIDVANKKGAADKLEKHLTKWVAIQQRDIDVKAEEKKAAGKKLSAADLKVKTRFKGGLVKHWTECLNGDKPLTDEYGFQFAVDVDTDARTISAPAIQFSWSSLSSEELLRMFDGFNDGATKLIPAIKTREQEEAAQEVDAEEEERFHAASKARLAEKAAKKAAEEAAREVEEDEPVAPVLADVADEIDEAMGETTDDETDGEDN